jgi:hypothetical protein
MLEHIQLPVNLQIPANLQIPVNLNVLKPLQCQRPKGTIRFVAPAHCFFVEHSADDGFGAINTA